jgi:DNA-binding transcriptional ArsR family regulator
MQTSLDTILTALANPTRRAILARLALGDGSVNELAEPFAMTQPAISQHLKVLENAGLILRNKEGQRRVCRIEGSPLKAVAEWLWDFRLFWDQGFDRIDDLLVELQQPEKTRGKHKDHKD